MYSVLSCRPPLQCSARNYMINNRGADKSLAPPRRKQTRKHVREARDFNNIETRAVINFFFPCKARRRRKLTPLLQKHQLVSFLVGLSSYYHPCTCSGELQKLTVPQITMKSLVFDVSREGFDVFRAARHLFLTRG